MLVLTRKLRETIQIGENVTVTILLCGKNRVQFGQRTQKSLTQGKDNYL